MAAAITARGLGIRYDVHLARRSLRSAVSGLLSGRPRGGSRALWALRDVTFDVPRGTVLGVVGRNGSGKSTLLLALAGLVAPDEGDLEVRGQRPTLLSLGAGFEPALSGRENLFLNGAYLGLGRAFMRERAEEIIEFSELGELIDAPLWTYSSGMRARLAFAIAAHLDPEILLLDEVLGVGDTAFQEKCGEKIQELMKQAAAIVIVSHQQAFLREHAEQVLWLEGGSLKAMGPAEETLEEYVNRSREARGPVRTLA